MTKIDFFRDHDFKDVKHLLDTEIKRLQSKGLGFIKHQAEVILSDEELLWNKGFLGDRIQLTVFFKWQRKHTMSIFGYVLSIYYCKYMQLTNI